MVWTILVIDGYFRTWLRKEVLFGKSCSCYGNDCNGGDDDDDDDFDGV